jgi:hypothetical protein
MTTMGHDRCLPLTELLDASGMAEIFDSMS